MIRHDTGPVHVRKTRTMKCTVVGGDNCNHGCMTGMNLGYARASTKNQDLTAKRNGLLALEASGKQIFVDHGLTGTNRAWPGLREAKAATRAGDTLVVTKPTGS